MFQFRQTTELSRKAIVLTPTLLSRLGSCVLITLCGDWGLAQGPPISPVDLVRLLGSDVFRERENATASLEQLGMQARDSILGGLKSDDPEVVRRCRLILPMVENLEMEGLIQKLSRPDFNPEELKVPGWGRFREIAGTGDSARKLFVEMCKSDLAFLRDVERKPEQGFDLIQAKCLLTQRNIQVPGGSGVVPIATGELGAILFCATNPKVRIPPNSLHTINNLLYNPSVRAAITTGDEDAPLRKLVSLWLASPTDPAFLVQNLYITTNLNLKEGVDIAVRILSPKDPKALEAVNAHQKSVALNTLGRMGSKTHIPLVQQFMADNAIVTNFQFNKEKGTTQVNDVALAMLIHLTGQNHKDYGFSFATNGRTLNFSPYGMGFTSAPLRKESFDKWEKWAKENPNKLKGN